MVTSPPEGASLTMLACSWAASHLGADAEGSVMRDICGFHNAALVQHSPVCPHDTDTDTACLTDNSKGESQCESQRTCVRT